MRLKPSAGLIQARVASRERIVAGQADREAAARYRDLALRQSKTVRDEFLARAVECDRIAAKKLQASR